MKTLLTFLFTIFLINLNLYGYWDKLDSPLGGQVTVIHNGNDSFYAGVFLDGLYRGDSNAEKWEIIGFAGQNIVAILETIDEIYVSSNTGLYISTDNGNNWERLVQTIGVQTVRSILEYQDMLYIVRYNLGVFQSSDNGQTWKHISEDLVQMLYNSLIVSDNGFWLATTEGIYYREFDSESWVLTDNGLINKSISQLNFYNGEIFASCSNFIYKYDTENNRWNKLNSPEKTAQNNKLTFGNNQIYYGTQFGLYQGNIDTQNWKEIKFNNSSVSVASLLILDNQLLIGTNGNGLLITDNAKEEWVLIGLSPANIEFIKFYDNVLYAGTQSSGLFKYNEFQDSWDYIGLASLACYDIVASQNFIDVGTNQGLFRTDDLGKTWKNIGPDDLRINKIASYNDKVFVATNKGLYSTGNDELSLKYHSFAGTNLLDVKIIYNDIFISVVNDGIFLLEEESGSWQRRNTGLPSSNIIKILNDGLELFAVAREGVYKSVDYGKNWTMLIEDDNNFSDFMVENNLMAALTNKDLFISTESGENWKAASNDIFNQSLISKSVLIDNNDIYIATHSAGIFKSKIHDIVSTREVSLEENTLKLYPNPALNEYINAEFYLNQSDFVKINIYDAMGKLLLSKFSPFKQTGKQKITIATNNLNNGMYLLEIICSEKKRYAQLIVGN